MRLLLCKKKGKAIEAYVELGDSSCSFCCCYGRRRRLVRCTCLSPKSSLSLRYSSRPGCLPFRNHHPPMTTNQAWGKLTPAILMPPRLMRTGVCRICSKEMIQWLLGIWIGACREQVLQHLLAWIVPARTVLINSFLQLTIFA